MDSLGEILHLCRLCLVKDHVNIPIFDDPGNIRQIPLKISSCLPVQISRNDNLPKKICDGCSEKLDLCYEFWNSSAIAEKKLLSMVAEKENQIVEPPVPQPILMKAELVPMDNITSEQVAEEENQSEPLVPQPIVVKQEAEVLDTFESSVERTEETEAPPSKRPRRSAAIKAQKNIVPESDDDDDDEGAATEDINSEEPLTKEEPYVDEDIHTEVPDMSVDDAQPGTSGLNQGMEDSTVYSAETICSSFNIDSLPTNLNLMESLDCPKSSENIPASSVVDQLNVSDELLNLLSTEEECAAILNTIATNGQFGSLSNFVEMADLQPLSGRPSEALDMYAKPPKITEFTCDICKKMFSTKKLLKKHLQRHNEKPSIPCEICGKVFRFRYELTEHKRSHSGPSFQCDVCPKLFVHKSHLNAHKKRHSKLFTTFCDVCCKGFISLNECTNHKRTVHNTSGFICETCGQKLSSSSSFKEHMSIHTRTPSHHACELCNRVYTTIKALKSHHKSVHSEIKQYVCSICRKSLSSKRTLETHVKMHTGLKDFLCTVCQKLFASKEYLEVHRRIHTNNKPYQCNECPKRFTQKTSLTVHLRYHSGERPYKCECGKNFISKSHLMSHYRTHDVGGVDIDYLNYHLSDSLE